MAQGSRPARVADQVRGELASLIAREVHDPGIGFVTLTRVEISPDLQLARVWYTALGDDKTRAASGRALERAAPFLRRQIGARLRLKRTPELRFVYDESIAGQDRIEQLLSEIHATDEASGAARGSGAPPLDQSSGRPEHSRRALAKRAGAGRGAPATDDDD